MCVAPLAPPMITATSPASPTPSGALFEATERVPAVTRASRSGSERRPRERVLIIVAQDQRALYGHLKWGFTGTPNVEVTLDQRLWRRRGPTPASESAPERRGGDRRRHPSMRAELLARGFLIVRVPSSSTDPPEWGGESALAGMGSADLLDPPAELATSVSGAATPPAGAQQATKLAQAASTAFTSLVAAARRHGTGWRRRATRMWEER